MTHRIQSLDALRGIAAVLVLAQHLFGYIWRSPAAGETTLLRVISLDYVDWGRLGVVLFFLISGYVIPFSFSGPTPLRLFVVTRTLRLYPAFWLSVLMMAGALALTAVPAATEQVLANMTMAYPAFRQVALTGVYWTLIIELVFYIVSFGLFAIGLLNSPLVLTGIALSGIATAVLPVLLNYATGSTYPDKLLGFHLSFLLLGSLFRLARMQVQNALPCIGVVASAVALAFPIVSGWLTGNFAAYSLGGPVAGGGGILAALAVFLGSWQFRFRAAPGIVLRLGAWSYSIYLLHEPVALTVHHWFKPNDLPQALAFFTLIFAITLTFSAAVYQLIEMPCIALGRSLYKA